MVADNPTIDLIYERLKLQVHPNKEYELKDQKYNTKDTYPPTSINVKQLLFLH